MSQKYIKTKNNNRFSKAYNKYYAQAVYDEKFIETLANVGAIGEVARPDGLRRLRAPQLHVVEPHGVEVVGPDKHCGIALGVALEVAQRVEDEIVPDLREQMLGIDWAVVRNRQSGSFKCSTQGFPR